MATIDLYENSDRHPAQVLSDFKLSAEARELMSDVRNTRGFLDRLTDAELFTDSFGVLARALPKNFAIVWALECVKSTDGTGRAESAAQCFQVVESWLAAPDEAGRRRAMEAAEAADYDSAEAFLAAAVGWSSGSVAPEGEVEVRPPDQLTAVAVAACLTMVVASEPELMKQRCSEFIERGLAMVA